MVFKVSLSRLKASLSKTKANFFEKIAQSVALHKTLDQQLLSELEEILINADVGVETTGKIIDRLRRRTAEEKTEDSCSIRWLKTIAAWIAAVLGNC